VSESGEVLDPGASANGHPPEREESLWRLTFPPAIWGLHFLLSYCTAAVWCAKVAGPGGSLVAGGPLDGVRVAVGAYTVVAVGAITVLGWIGFQRHAYGAALAPHDDDTPEDRHRFLGLATVLLAGLSAVATLYTALVAVFFESCR
jgi:hypothetical protein